MGMRGKPSLRYLVSLLIVMIIALGVDRYLVVWEWTFGKHWFTVTRFRLVALYLLSSIGILHFFMIRNRIAKVFVFTATWLSLAFVGFFIIAEDRSPELRDLLMAFGGMENFFVIAVAALKAYQYIVVIALVAAFVVTLELGLLGKRAATAPGWKLSFGTAMLAFVGSVVCVVSMDKGGEHSPLYVKMPVLLSKYMNHNFVFYRGPRDKPRIAADPAKAAKSHILFIMDESVAGFSLGINGCEYDSTKFLNTLSAPYFSNYGLAVSAANYSELSNIIVCSGLRADQLPDDEQRVAKNTSVFGYAKAAGRETWYVDAQNPKLSNLLSTSDLLDFSFEQIVNLNTDMPAYRFDREGLRKTGEIIRSATEPTFVFLVKTGVHQLFWDKYPPGTDGGGLDAKNPESRDYLKGIRWAVDGFFEELQRELEGSDVIVIYTSDHGIDIDFESETDRDPYVLAYGKKDRPTFREVTVPLFIWCQSEQALRDFTRAGGYIEENFNAATHFQLFPTVMRLMGYERDSVSQMYGASLFDSPPGKRLFATAYFMEDQVERRNKGWLHEYTPLP